MRAFLLTRHILHPSSGPLYLNLVLCVSIMLASIDPHPVLRRCFAPEFEVPAALPGSSPEPNGKDAG
jgi:hypothetical protein